MLQKVSDTQLPVTTDEEIVDDYETLEWRAPDEPKRRSISARVALALLQAVLSIALLFAAYMVANRLIASAPEAKKRPAFQTVYTVETVNAVSADNQPAFITYGQTVAARTVDLRALVAGEIVAVSPELRAGARVEKGASLVEIDDFEYRGALAEARANLLEAQGRVSENEALIAAERDKEEPLREQLELARADLARGEQLRQRGSGTQQQLEARRLIVSQREQAMDAMGAAIAVQEARLAQFQASLERLQWRVQQAQRNLESTTLSAPFTSIVREASAEVGRTVSANDVVVSLYEAGSLEVSFTLSDAQYGRLQASEGGLIGRAVEVTWTVGGKAFSYPATVERLGADITSTRGGVEVFAAISDLSAQATLRPGAFVEVKVPDRVFADTFAIPDTAIYGGNTVYIEVDGKLVEKPVTIAAYDGEMALISDGIAEGDKVLTTRITEVTPGLAVRREGDPVERPKRSDDDGEKPDGEGDG